MGTFLTEWQQVHISFYSSTALFPFPNIPATHPTDHIREFKLRKS
jgi:hypothetical protein